MDWSWAVEGVTEETPRTTGPECINYMTNRRRWIEAVLFTLLFIFITRWAVKRLDPIILPSARDIDKPHSAIRLMLLIAMTFIFGVEVGFKFAGKSVIFVLNPCHIQTMLQIYLLAAKPSKTTTALFRIQMNNLNGPLLAFLFPEVECRTLPFEQATYWIQHALLYIIPVYIIKSGAYKMEPLSDYNWVAIGVSIMLLYHFTVLNALSILTDINLNHMLCAAVADPFQGQNYRIAAVIHESILCPILNKVTVLIFNSSSDSDSKSKQMPLEIRERSEPQTRLYHQQQQQQQQLQQQQSQTQSHSQQHHEEMPPKEMSLAAEMAAAMGQPMGAILTHRQQHRSQHATPTKKTAADGGGVGGVVNASLRSGVEAALDRGQTTAISSEYTMPTTKID